MLKTVFSSDNASGVDLRIIRELEKCSSKYHVPYGHEELVTDELFSELLEQDVKAYFVYNGTAANVLGITSGLRSHQAVVCADTGHINVDECGALEKISGCKILYVPSDDGKIRPQDVEAFLWQVGSYHRVQPKVIYITQSTELGGLYSLEEIRELADFAHAHEMYLYLDGARIANALVALDCSAKELLVDTGVDICSFGGTKNGLMFGEAVIFLNTDLAKDFDFYRKQNMQLHSKHEYIYRQYEAYVNDGIYLENAKKANEMATYLEKELRGWVELERPVETNMLFLRLNEAQIDAFCKEYDSRVFGLKNSVLRLVTSFMTDKREIFELADVIKRAK